ncbi:MAG TPA: O-antigen ligase family protein [Gaiella sp.]
MSTQTFDRKPPAKVGPHVGEAPARDLRVLLGYGTILAVAAGVGGAAGMQPMLAIGAVLALTVAVITLVNLTAGVCMFVAIMFLETLPGVSGGPSVTKLVGLLLVAGWLAAMAIATPEERASRDILSRNFGLVLLLLVFLSWAVASLMWAEDTSAGRSSAMRFALNAALFPIVYAALRTPRHVQWLFALFITGTLMSAAIGVASGQLYEGNRLEGAGINANQLGMLLMVATVLAVALGCGRNLSQGARLGIFAVAGLCAIALIATASRGAMLGMAVALLVTPFLAGRGRRVGALGLIGLAVVVGFVVISMFAPTSGVSRLTQGYSSGTGRVDIWTVALRMVEDKPVLGVGAGSFKASSIHYLLEPGTLIRDEFIVDEPHVPHNIYLNVLVELGAVGLVLFLLVLGYCLLAALRAARAFARLGDTTAEILARGLLIALVGLLAAEFFSSQLYSKQLWLLLATAPALVAVARRSGAGTP